MFNGVMRQFRRRMSGFESRSRKWRTSRVQLALDFPQFAPSSAGSYAQIHQLTRDSIQKTLPALVALAASQGSPTLAPIEGAAALVDTGEKRRAAAELKSLFDKHGSDKARGHGYEAVYGALLSAPERIQAVLEIGLGTNNTDVASNVGEDGVPGASLRALKDFLPNALIHGADIDQRIMFTDERIHTFLCDQTSVQSMRHLTSQVLDAYDLIIDDGLHSPHANLVTLNFALPLLRRGGSVVIEDIAPEHLDVWRIVQSLIDRSQYDSRLVFAMDKYVFIASRVA